MYVFIYFLNNSKKKLVNRPGICRPIRREPPAFVCLFASLLLVFPASFLGFLFSLFLCLLLRFLFVLSAPRFLFFSCFLFLVFFVFCLLRFPFFFLCVYRFISLSSIQFFFSSLIFLPLGFSCSFSSLFLGSSDSWSLILLLFLCFSALLIEFASPVLPCLRVVPQGTVKSPSPSLFCPLRRRHTR